MGDEDRSADDGSDGTARDAGRAAVSRVRKRLAEKAAEILRNDPELSDQAVEVGLVAPDWFDDPANRPISDATPLEMLHRFLERSVERRPSLVAEAGLSALNLLESRADPESDRGPTERAAIVFTDLEGFTRYTARHGDDAATAVVEHLHRSAGPVVRSWRGRVVKRLGDGMLLAFERADDAVRAGLELVDDLDGPLRLRAGLHIGEIVRQKDDVYGHTVNLAARVTAATRAGLVVATEAVRDEAGAIDGVSFGRLRRRNFKGIDETVRVCTVRRVG